MNKRLLLYLVPAVPAFAVSLWLDSRTGQLDDAFITYQYARRIAEGCGFSFSPGMTPTYGTTTPLWTLLLAGIARLGAAPHLSAPWLIAGFHAVTAGLLAALFGVVAGLCWAVALSLMFHSGGMETALLVALSMGTVALVMRRASGLWVGLVCGLVLLTRPDAVLLVAAVVAALLIERRGMAALQTSGVAVAVCLPWAAYAMHAFGSLVPITLAAKRELRFLYEAASLPNMERMLFPGVVSRQVV